MAAPMSTHSIREQSKKTPVLLASDDHPPDPVVYGRGCVRSEASKLAGTNLRRCEHKVIAPGASSPSTEGRAIGSGLVTIPSPVDASYSSHVGCERRC